MTKDSMVGNVSSHELQEQILSIFEKNPNKFFSAQEIFQMIGKRHNKYFSNILWSLAKKGFLVHTGRANYILNTKSE